MGCGGGDAAALGDGVWTEAQGGLPGCGGEKLSALRVLRTLPALSDSRGSLHPPAGPHPAGRSKGLCAHLCEHHARSCRTTPQVCKQCSKTVLPPCALSSALTLKNTMWRRLWRVEFTAVFGHTCTFFGSHAPPMACAGFLRFPGHTCRFSAARLHRQRSLGTLIAHTHRCRTAGAHVDEALFPAAQAPEHLPCLVRKRVSTRFRADGGSCKLVLFVLFLEK